tara:strand:- start:91 stop:441 length:351 start_codon:yes stop_codon:yes gene_type:complete
VDNFSAIIFLVTSISLLAGAVWLIVSAANSRPVRDFNAGRLTGEWSTEVVKPIHPEMKDVEPGTKLLGVNFEKKTECDLEEYRDLQARIEALKAELESDIDDDEDDDDDGDVVVRV